MQYFFKTYLFYKSRLFMAMVMEWCHTTVLIKKEFKSGFDFYHAIIDRVYVMTTEGEYRGTCYHVMDWGEAERADILQLVKKPGT